MRPRNRRSTSRQTARAAGGLARATATRGARKDREIWNHGKVRAEVQKCRVNVGTRADIHFPLLHFRPHFPIIPYFPILFSLDSGGIAHTKYQDSYKPRAQA